jgi:gas vesicle protein
LAPQSGRESREQVRGYARRAEAHVHELADKAIQVMDREFIKDKQTVVTEAVEAGRTAIQWKREAG